jgi:hypothetical protein
MNLGVKEREKERERKEESKIDPTNTANYIFEKYYQYLSAEFV